LTTAASALRSAASTSSPASAIRPAASQPPRYKKGRVRTYASKSEMHSADTCM
jgi:hypothetical protein